SRSASSALQTRKQIVIVSIVDWCSERFSVACISGETASTDSTIFFGSDAFDAKLWIATKSDDIERPYHADGPTLALFTATRPPAARTALPRPGRRAAGRPR